MIRRPGQARRGNKQERRAVKQEAVQHMRQRVPVGDVLRIFRALHHAVPEFDIAAGADRQPAHREQDRGLQREDGARDQQPVPGRKRAGGRSLVEAAGNGHAVANHQESGAIRSIDHTSFFKSRFLVGANRAGICGIGIGHDARRAARQPDHRRSANERRPMAALDHVGLTDEEVDAAGAFGVSSKTRIPCGQVIALEIAEIACPAPRR